MARKKEMRLDEERWLKDTLLSMIEIEKLRGKLVKQQAKVA